MAGAGLFYSSLDPGNTGLAAINLEGQPVPVQEEQDLTSAEAEYSRAFVLQPYPMMPPVTYTHSAMVTMEATATPNHITLHEDSINSTHDHSEAVDSYPWAGPSGEPLVESVSNWGRNYQLTDDGNSPLAGSPVYVTEEFKVTLQEGDNGGFFSAHATLASPGLEIDFTPTNATAMPGNNTTIQRFDFDPAVSPSTNALLWVVATTELPSGLPLTPGFVAWNVAETSSLKSQDIGVQGTDMQSMQVHYNISFDAL